MTIKQFGELTGFHVPGPRDDAGPGGQHRAGAVHQVQPRDPVHEQHRVRARARVRARGLPAAAPRPAELAATDQDRQRWLPVAAFLCVLNALFLVVGALAPKLNGYGTWTDFGIGVGVLVGSLLLFIYRRVVQDREGVHLREDVPLVPSRRDAGRARASPVPAAAMRVIKTILVGYDDSEPAAPRAGARRDARQGARCEAGRHQRGAGDGPASAGRSAPTRSNRRRSPRRACTMRTSTSRAKG